MPYFPLFVDLTNKKCLVVGGGRIAYHKTEILLEFGARVDIVSLEFEERFYQLLQTTERIRIEQKKVVSEDIKDYFLVIAATDQVEVNQDIARICRQNKILVNVVNDQEACDFSFGSVVKEGDLVAAFSSSGKSPVMTQYLKKKEQEILTKELGQINDELGRQREELKNSSLSDKEKRKIYQQTLQDRLNHIT